MEMMALLIGWWAVRHETRRGDRASGAAFDAAAEVSSLEDRTLLSATGWLQPADGSPALWQRVTAIPQSIGGATSYLRTSEFVPLTMNEAALRQSLAAAPKETSPGLAPGSRTISIADPTGKLQRFAIYESSIMEPALAAQFPDIKTYAGQGIDDPSASVRLDMSPAGFHAQVLSPNGRWYVDPYFHLNDDFYASYYASSLTATPEVRAGVQNAQPPQPRSATATPPAAPSGFNPQPESATVGRSGTQLRTYRAAVAATGEYVAFHGGTVPLGQAAIVTAMNRVNGIYENELSIRMVLVANNSTIVYTNGATDPYSNNNPGALLDENQANLDALIGNANYDIGHVFTTGGGGLAGLGVVGIDGVKAWGETGLSNPIGDPFYVDYVAHEMGHQFGGNHTFNQTDGNRNASTAYEPGSGSTIMAYAGLFGVDDLQPNSDAYFHSASFDEIIDHVDTVIPGVGTRTATGNNVPTVNAGLDYTIPTGTPFVLTATGADADGTGSLTYNWEQRDLGPSQVLADPDNGQSPLFRSFNPTSDPSRTFVRLTDVVNGTTTRGDELPTVARPSMDFRVTVRDNRAGGGAVNTDDMVVSVVNTGAVFRQTSQNSATNWTGGSTQTITWDVAGTTTNGINTANVRILLSTDGGVTFPTVVSASEVNDGSASITVPNIATTTGRIRIEAVGNIFFDVNDANITIVAAIGGEIDVAQGATNIPDGTGSVDFGSVGVGGTSNRVFTVSNTGVGDLVLQPITVTGDFTLSGANFTAGQIVAPGGSANFTVAMTTATPGAKTGTVSFANDDADENPFNFALTGNVTNVTAPEITVTENSVDVPDGSAFDFGAAVVGSTSTRQFTVQNTGNANLTLQPITATGDFSVSGANFTAGQVLAPNATATVTIAMSTAMLGAKAGTLSFVNTDADETPFNLTLSGNVTAALAPEIEVTIDGGDQPDGGAFSFGSTTIGVAVTKNFLVRNIGTADLTVQPATLTGAGFSINTNLVANQTIQPGQTGLLALTMTAAAIGSPAGSVSFATTDGDENPFNFTIGGTVTGAPAPEIAVTESGIDVPDGSAYDFGSTSIGAPITKTFVVTNAGNANLTVQTATLVGAGYSIVTNLGANQILAAGQTANLVVTMTAAAVGNPTGSVSFVNTDSNENPFNFSLTGQVTNLASIAGQVFHDQDADGAKDAGEPGLAGRRVYLDTDNDATHDITTVNQNSTDVPKAIADNATTDSTLTIAGVAGNVRDINVRVDITHPFVGDLDVFLISPTGTTIELFTDVALIGQNFTNTVLDDEARDSISFANAPFAGTFRPEGVLAGFDGEVINGLWTLRVIDDSTPNGGTLNSWSLQITSDASEPFADVDANGNYQFSNLTAGSYVVRSVLPAGWASTAPAGNAFNLTVANGQQFTGRDFGHRATFGEINGLVWDDANGDQTRNAGEPGFGGLTVYLDADNDAVMDAGETRVLTDQQGNYYFTNLAAGSYNVRIVPPLPTVLQTTPVNAGGNPLAQVTTVVVNQFTGPRNFGALFRPDIVSFGPDVTYTQNDPPVLLSPAGIVLDPDSPVLNGGRITVTLTQNATVDDRLLVQPQGTGLGSISISGANIRYNSGTTQTIGTFTGGDGSNPLVIDLNANATTVATTALLRAIAFENISLTPSELQRTATFVVRDGTTRGVSDVFTRLINVVDLAEPPEIAVTLGTTNVPDGGSVNFGTTTVGSPVLRTFTITNTGLGTLTLQPATIAGAGYSIVTNFTVNQTVPSNGTATLVVRLDATAVGAPTGTVSFVNNDSDENPFDINVSGVVNPAPQPEIQIANQGGGGVNDGGTVNFGTTTVGLPIVRTLVVTNTGPGVLTLQPATITGTGFTIMTNVTAGQQLALNQSANIVVRMNATAVGSPAALLQLVNNDANENPYDISLLGVVNPAPAPEIDVTIGGAPLADGGSIAFGTTPVGTPVTRTIAVRNTGNLPLILQPATAPTGFAITTNFTAGQSVPPNGTVNLIVRLTATTFGTFNGVVSFANNDGDENPFDINVTGIATAPEIAVTQGATNVPDGSTVNFGTTFVPGNVTRVFTITNQGNSNLTLQPLTLTGTGFSIVANLTAGQIVAPAGTATFSVRLDGAVALSADAQLAFANTDADENPFNIRLIGTVVSPSIRVSELGDRVLANGSSTVDMGIVPQGVPMYESFRVENTGTGNLNIASVTVPAGFTVVNAIPANTVIAPGQFRDFFVAVSGATLGTFSGNVRITSSDVNLGVFQFGIRAQVLARTPGRYYIDNESQAGADDVGTAFDVVGAWTAAKGTGLGFARDDLSGAANEGKRATWRFNVGPGDFTVSARWLAAAGRATNAQYVIRDGSTNAILRTATINQAVAPNDFTDFAAAWENLGAVSTLSGQIVVELTDTANGTLSIDAMRVEQVAPEVSVSLSGVNVATGREVDFGVTPIGTTVSRTFVLTNTGVGRLVLQPPAAVAGYTITQNIPANTQLATGQSVNLVVRLDATAASSPSGNLSIPTNDADENPFVIALRGSVTTSQSMVRVIDDGGVGYTTSGTWSVTSNSGYHRDLRTAAAGSNARSTWTFGGLQPGRYRIAATYNALATFSSAAPYTLIDGTNGTTLATATVNQQQPPKDFVDLGVAWKHLGEFNITGSSLVVQLNAAVVGLVNADAIRVERVPPTVVIADNASPSFTRTGSWASLPGSGYAGGMLTSAAPSTSKATWSFTDLAPGQYWVSATWSGASAFAANAPFAIRNGANNALLRSVAVNQQQAPLDFADAGTGWKSLALVTITGNSLVVELGGAAANGAVAADAVRVERAAPRVAIIDNSEPGFGATSGWNLATGAGSGRNNNFRGAPAGSGSEVATWNFQGLTPGQYRVSATWTAFANRATDAKFALQDGFGGPVQSIATVNQSVAPNDFSNSGSIWENLGVVTVSGDALVIRLNNLANNFVTADAVRIERIDAASQSIDDSETGFSRVGSWTHNGSGRNGGSQMAAANTGSGAYWSFRTLAPGKYTVSATWTASATLATNAPFVVRDAYSGALLSLVTTNQRVAPADFAAGGSNWKRLGDVTITSGAVIVGLLDFANGPVLADAIRLDPAPGGSSTPASTGSARTDAATTPAGVVPVSTAVPATSESSPAMVSATPVATKRISAATPVAKRRVQALDAFLNDDAALDGILTGA